MKKLSIFLCLFLSSVISTTNAREKNIQTSFVGISLSKVMEALSTEQEALRELEAPTAILLYTADDRIEDVTQKLKKQIKAYEEIRKVRVDILTTSHELPDYTEDFLNHLEEASDE